MKHNTLTALAASALISFTVLPATLQSATVVNRTIATVNGEAVLQSEFEKNCNNFFEQQKNFMPADQMTPAWEKDTRKKILQSMIDDKVLLIEANKRKIRVNQRELENGVIQVKSRFLPEDGRKELDGMLQKAMANLPQDPALQDPNAIDLPSLWRDLTKSNPTAVKQAEEKFKEELAKEGLNDRKYRDRIQDQIRVAQLIQMEVRERAVKPTDEDAKALFGRVTQTMEGKEVKGLDPESKADLDSMAKYFTAQTGERVKARHILLRIDRDAPFKDKSAVRKKLLDIREKIVKGADFGEMAKLHSDDKASGARGGDLGVFMRGQMVPEFDKAAFSLPVGQVSSVVETDFGMHILIVDEKKAASKLRYEDVENDMKEYVYRANQQKAYEKFLEDMRQGASIKILINLDETAQ